MKTGLTALLLALCSLVAEAQAPDPTQSMTVAYVWLTPGVELRLHAGEAEPVAAPVKALSFVPVFARHQGWAQVMLHGVRYWVNERALANELPTPAGGLSRRKASPEPHKANLAARFLPGHEPRALGSFRLVTDHPHGPLLDLLDALAWKIEQAYQRRYGLDISALGGETVLLFSTAAAYQAFVAAKPGLAIADATGLAGRTVAATYVGERSSWEVGSAFVHELTHLLNRRVFKDLLPPFLEEGLAEDLDCFWAEDPFAPAPGMMGARWNQGEVTVVGCYTPMVRVAQGGAPPDLLAPERLPGLDRRAYVEAASYSQNQQSSAWFVAYLLDGENALYAAAFRAFLAEVAAGRAPTGERLLELVGRSWSELDAAYRAFVDARIQAYGGLMTASSRWLSAFNAMGVQLAGPEAEQIDFAELTRTAMATRAPPRAETRPRKEYAYRWLHPGTRLLDAPNGTAHATIVSLSFLPIVEEREGWTAIRHQGNLRWVDKATSAPAGKAKTRWKSPRPDAEELGLALRLFGTQEPTGTLGPFKLYTDSKDSALLAALSEAAEHLEAAYEHRFGLEIATKATEVVLLFEQRDDFRALATSRPNLRISDPLGFAGQGTAILFAGDRSRWDVLETLIHELTHVLNRRRLDDPRPPPWLEEGLASDLACLWTEDPNAPAPGLLRMESAEGEWFSVGSLCAARLLMFRDQTEVRKLPTVEQLVSASDERFYANRHLGSYLAAQLLVSYFLDGEEGALAPGFKAFLNDAAQEKAPTPKLLQKRLGRSWDELDTGFRLFVAEEAKRLGELMAPGPSRLPPG